MKLILITILTLSFTTVLAAENGIFMVVKGLVKIETSGVFQDAKVGSKVNVGDTVITENESRAKIVMSDRNIISLSPNTKLKIEKYTNSKNDKNVDLRLIEGKVRNNVEQKYNTSNSKFEVRTATAVAGVRGTQFITSFDKQTQVTEVITLQGQVSFKSISANANNTTETIVNKNHQSTINENSQTPTEPAPVKKEQLHEIQKESFVGKEPQPSTIEPQKPPVPNINDIANQADPLKKRVIDQKFKKSKVNVTPVTGN